MTLCAPLPLSPQLSFDFGCEYKFEGQKVHLLTPCNHMLCHHCLKLDFLEINTEMEVCA